MFEKIKKIFSNKEKRIENLISFLIILIITLIIINKILQTDEKTNQDYTNQVGVELATETIESKSGDINLERKLENILSKIEGVGKVSVLITYSESSTLIPIYNVNDSTSKIEEKDTSGGIRITETKNNQKDVITDSGSNVITEKVIQPKIEGAIITAKGASNSNIKSNIIMAVEAVTGLATHKIQVFTMGED